MDVVDRVTRAIVIHESNDMVEELGLPDDLRLEMKQATNRRTRELSAAATLQDIRPGSITLELVLTARDVAVATVVLGGYLLKESLKEAWLASPAHQRLRRFLDSAFQGARRQAEEAVVEATRQPRGGIRPSRVREVMAFDGNVEAIEIVLVRLPTRTAPRSEWPAAEELLRDLLGDGESDQ